MPEYSVSPAVPVIDYASCRRAKGKECSACVQACAFDAISFAEKESQSQIPVDNIVIATGYEPYNPSENSSYGYGQMENIITGQEAEQQLARRQAIVRPSDGETPKRIAFIQCVGSRSEEAHLRPEDTNYCSTVCCSYALRIAQLMKHQSAESEITIFYMDIQNFGKGFDDFYRKCQDSMTFVRSRPYEIRQGSNGAVRVKYAPSSVSEEIGPQVCEEEFDLVVLAVGIRPDPEAVKLAETLRVPLDEFGFFGFKDAAPLPDMQREGIFAAGACESPKDIQSSMAQADAVSAMIMSQG
jgi:heterodisulfide reductase subunit A